MNVEIRAPRANDEVAEATILKWNKSDGAHVTAGYYRIAVDTSLGTLSRCIRITERCPLRCFAPGRCLSRCTCDEAPDHSECCCKVSLEFVVERACCFPLFRLCEPGCP